MEGHCVILVIQVGIFLRNMSKEACKINHIGSNWWLKGYKDLCRYLLYLE